MTRKSMWTAAALLAVSALCADAAALDGWLRTREDGIEAARRSGKPILVVTIWKDGV